MSLSPQLTERSASATSGKIKVMVVDDSVVIRGLISRWLGEVPELEVVSAQRTGLAAVNDLVRAAPDVVVLDIEMPEMDGLTALPKLLALKRDLIVIMASTLTQRNAEASMKALSLGAKDYIPKPEGNHGVTTSMEFRRELVEKVKALGAAARRRAAAAARPAGALPERTAAPVKSSVLRPFSNVVPRILAIGSSTGGPQALNTLFSSIGSSIGRIPVVVTQHMPATFTATLAAHIEKASQKPAREGQHGEPVLPGHIYVAPGGKHMVLDGTNAAPTIKLTVDPPVNFCRPAVDPLFESVAKLYGPAILSLVLTGMGSDGALGAKAIADAGGSVIAQDEASSVVWGMPGATANIGACSAILPLNDISVKVRSILGASR